MKRQCIVCFRILLSAFNDEEEITDIADPPSDGIYLSSLGNYGSIVFDGGEFTGEYLETFICDECLKNRAHIIFRCKDHKIISTLNDYILGDHQ